MMIYWQVLVDDFLASACGDEKYEFAAVRVLKVKLVSFTKLDKNHFEQIYH